MMPLYEDPHFTFRFADDRIISRFHLEGLEVGRHVSIFKIDPDTGEKLSLLATAIVGDGGWVDLAEPIIVRAGEAFIAVPVADPVPQIRPVRIEDQAEWARMRSLIWPDDTKGGHAEEIAAFFATGSFAWSDSLLAVAIFVAVRSSGGLCGFLEASIRPFADDCETRPVGYVEGWFVDADMRQQGIGKKLVTAAETWAVAQGCKEMASDANLENTVSVKAHLALGFEESSRSVHLRKRLTEASGMTSERNKSPRQLSLVVVDGIFAVCRLNSNVSIPAWATEGNFLSITRTADELSVVGRQEAVPESIVCERGWRCLRVAGTIAFSVVGVIASLTAPLAVERISVFTISTFDTDYLFFKDAEFQMAVAALRRAGHSVEEVLP